ncbi:hypothetical protein Syncc9605_2133 [Synechococcus sp. CC9605]|nr:hypothetical protein Syncc9605_2133 [Synechococcus sp. CC9605]
MRPPPSNRATKTLATPPTNQGGATQANGIKDCCSDQPNSDRALSWGIRDGTTCNDGDQKDKMPDETKPSRYCRAGAKQGLTTWAIGSSETIKVW